MKVYKKDASLDVMEIGEEVSLQQVQTWVEGFKDDFGQKFTVDENQIRVESEGGSAILEANHVILRDGNGNYSQVTFEEYETNYISTEDLSTVENENTGSEEEA